MKKTAVIGGGISGIASAYYLNRQGIPVDLYEADLHPGGRIGSQCLDGHWLDFGGKNIGKRYRRFRGFIDSLGGMEFEYFGFNTSQLLDGRVVSINKESAGWFNILRFFQLCGVPGFLKLLPMAISIQKEHDQGFLNTPYFNAVAGRSDHDTLAAYFSERCISHVIRPVTVRMNGAEPDECYPGNFGSNLALLLDSYEQLTESMFGMIGRFVDASPLTRVLAGYRVTSLCRQAGSGTVTVDYESSGVPHQAEYERVVAALPAAQLWPLFGSDDAEAVRLLRQVLYFPVAVAVVKYRDRVFQDDRRAMVFDRRFPLSNAGAYGIGDLDLVRYTFSGREARKVIMPATDPQDVIATGERIIKPYFAIDGNRRESFLYRYLPVGLCAYSQYHSRLLAGLDRMFRPERGLVLTGDYWRGASIEACFTAAFEAVEKLLNGESS
jgi:oxygen-dependent protoporphyrinogen oxidase